MGYYMEKIRLTHMAPKREPERMVGSYSDAKFNFK